MGKQRIIDYIMNTPGNTNPNVLNSLLDEEMNDLPDTSSASAGDVLGLDNDKNPVWTTPSSGGGMLEVTATPDEQTGIITLNKTWKEIADAKISYCILSRKRGNTNVTMIPYPISFSSKPETTYDQGGEIVTMPAEYIVTYSLGSDTQDFTTDSENGYPFATRD